MQLATGTRLGPYEVVGLLGAGGMGEVYRARDSRLGREVAIKVLPAELAFDRDRLRRFEQEARAASSLNHPGILTIHDFGEHQGTPYLVSELLEGETLRDRLRAGAVSSRQLVDHGVQIARGLAAAHAKGIVHRDLKPENLFLTGDGRIKILDFGLAKQTDSAPGAAPLTEAPTHTAQTAPGVLIGTLAYMAPEQVRGLPADQRSDIFAVGTILYEMATGRRAFSGSTPADTVSAILKEEPLDPSRPHSGVPLALERVVRRCLEKNPDARFQSAADLAFALEESSSVDAVAPATARRLQAGRRPALRGVAVVLAAGAIAFLAYEAVRSRRAPAPIAPRIASIAVLPLRDLSAAAGQEYFAAGVTEAITTQLAGIRSLRVISSTSSAQYKDTKRPLREIARELNVDAILEGSVVRAENRVRVTAELIEGRSDAHVWARSFDRDAGNVLSIQQEIAREVVRQIQAKLSPDEEKRLSATAAVNPKAYEAYLRGRFYLDQGTEEDLGKALQQFNDALELESGYAAAYSGIARYYSVLPFYSALSPADVFPKARGAAERSLELDESLAEAHASLAYIRAYYEWDWPAAEKEFRRALDLSPNYADAHFSYSRFLAAAGRMEEAMAEIARARELDPRSSLLEANMALLLYFDGKYDDALKQLRALLEREPDFPVAHWGAGLCHEQRGDGEAALAAIQKAGSLSKSLNIQASLAHAYGVFGKPAEARKIRDSLRERARAGYVPSYHFALIELGLGQREPAMEWLERAYQERSTVIAYLRLDPRLAPLHGDPRFGQLLTRLGLPSMAARMGAPN